MNNLMWYLTRSTGFVALGLAVAALAWGFFFSARETGSRKRPNWWLDLHNWLGGAALVFTGIHLATAYLDRDLALSVAGLFVPGAASLSKVAIAWGVLSAWLFAIAVFTSWPRRRFDRRTWRILHLGSVIGVALAIVHTEQIGTDARSLVTDVAVIAMVSLSVYALMIRVFGIVYRER